jgi:hypothetical protein
MTAIKNGTILINSVVDLLKKLDESQNNDVEEAKRLNEEITSQIGREMTIIEKLMSSMKEDKGNGNTGDGNTAVGNTAVGNNGDMSIGDTMNLLPTTEVEKKKKKGSNIAKEVDSSNIVDSNRTRFPVDPALTKTNFGGTRKRSKRRRSRRCSTKRKRNQKKRKATRRKRRKQNGGYTYKTSV